MHYLFGLFTITVQRINEKVLQHSFPSSLEVSFATSLCQLLVSFFSTYVLLLWKTALLLKALLRKKKIYNNGCDIELAFSYLLKDYIYGWDDIWNEGIYIVLKVRRFPGFNEVNYCEDVLPFLGPLFSKQFKVMMIWYMVSKWHFFYSSEKKVFFLNGCAQASEF